MRWMVLAVVLMGCGSDGKSIGEVCDDLGYSYCKRVQDCGITTYNICFGNFKSMCCLNARTCNNPWSSANVGDVDAWETECRAAFEAQDCREVAVGATPATCLVKH